MLGGTGMTWTVVFFRSLDALVQLDRRVTLTLAADLRNCEELKISIKLFCLSKDYTCMSCFN